MKMFARLRYLIEEGFEVASISGYDDASGGENAKVMFVERKRNAAPRVHSEIFVVNREEMEHCSSLFLKHLGKR
jgi:hypothetical protein